MEQPLMLFTHLQIFRHQEKHILCIRTVFPVMLDDGKKIEENEAMNNFLPGIEVLLQQHRNWLAGRRIGLVSHTAAVDSRGCTSASMLHRETNLVCIMGPEHGFSGKAGAGEFCGDSTHPFWKIPVFSLFGKRRKPTPAMLNKLDTIVFDIQDIGARPYTFVSTLRLVLEAASENGTEVIIADRPIPLPNVIDGPITEDKFSSFVAMIPSPMSYGMTPGETALWMNDLFGFGLKIRVARMQNYFRQSEREKDWPPYIPPSPAITSWDAAASFPATVFCEGIQSIDCGRRTCLPFQVLGAKWMDGQTVSHLFNGLKLPGIVFVPHSYNSQPFEQNAKVLRGIWLRITDRDRFRPVLTAVSMIHSLQQEYGKDKLWHKPAARTGWFDKLFGTDTVRLALLDGDDGAAISLRWQRQLAAFSRQRQKHLLYSRKS